MTISLVEQTLNPLIQTAIARGQLTQTRQTGDYTLQGRVEPLGKGYLQAFQLRPGLRLRVVSFESQQEFRHCQLDFRGSLCQHLSGRVHER
jgi:hypothetical protein